MPDSVTPAVVPTPVAASRRGSGRLRRLLVVGLTVTGLLATAACDLAGANDAAPQPKKGGTLFVNLNTPGGFDSLDPQVAYTVNAANVGRLLTRTLTTYRSQAGAGASQVVPDLATDTGRASENNTIWKFTLKPNVKWQGGELVTCSQVKYGIERSFSSLLPQGATYPKAYLQPNADKPYLGPYLDNDNNGKGLESIQCVDERNIVFHLSRPVSDFNYAVAMSVFAPVIPEKDTKLKYGDSPGPYSDGPYKIASRDDKQMVLVRNNFWTEQNDQVRKAYPDKVVIMFRSDDGSVTNDLIQDQGDARNTVMLDSSVAPAFLQQVVNDPDLSARTISGPTTITRMMMINTTTEKNPACRQALIYAFNKRKYRAVYGGAVGGEYATTVIPPGVTGHKDFDLYDSNSNPEGSPDKAIAIMQEQARKGTPCKSTINVPYVDTPTYRRLMATVVEAYQLAGIQVVLHPIQGIGAYYTRGIGDPRNTYDLMPYNWVPDWASGSAILPAIYDGRNIPIESPDNPNPAGNVDVSMLNDPKVNQQIDAALSETDPAREAALWGDLDQQIQQQAVTIPIMYDRAIYLTGTNVVGGYIHPAFSEPDIAALGLAQP